MEQEFIKIDKLNKYYSKGTKREVHAINNTTLTFPDRGLVCILGESGSGKTTLMHAIGAQDTFSSGTVEVAGKKLTGRMNRNAENLRNEEYGFVFQNYYLLNDETVYENLKLALCMYDLSKEQQDERINYVLEAVDMLRYRKRRISELSGGQRQRVAIARALVRMPRVIFADEPVGNLDENNTMLVMGILKKVSRTTLIVLTTHEKRLARFFADRIIQVYDGKVVSDEENTPMDSYQLSDDKNIYLGEYPKHNVLSDEVAIEAFGSFDEPFTMQLVECGGKYYFSIPEGIQAEILTKDSEIQLKQGKRLALALEEVENRNYELPRLQPKKGGMLSARQIASMVVSAFSSRKGKLLFPLLCMFITAVMVVIVVSDFLSLAKMDTQEFAITNSKMLHVKLEKDTWVKMEEFTEIAQKLAEEFLTDVSGTIYPVFSLDVSVKNSSFEQMAKMSEYISGYSYTPLSLFDESTLLYGRMPEMPNEVIIDKSVLESFMARRNLVSQSFADVRQFLNYELLVAKKSYNLIIVGISDGKEKSLYIDDMAGIGYSIGTTAVASLSHLKKAYPGRYDDIVLAEDEAIISETRAEAMLGYKWFSESYGVAYRIRDVFPEEFAAAYVVSDELYSTLLKRQIVNVKEFVVFTEDKEGVAQYLKDRIAEDKDLLGTVRITVTDDYGTKVSAFLAERSKKLAGRALVTVMILLLSLIMLAISMKTMAMRNVENISVYRLLGIRGKSIVYLYAATIAALSFCSTLPGILICAGVLRSVSGIEALQLDFFFGLPVMLLTILVLFSINIFVGLTPIWRIVKIPPAQLATKSDI